MTMTMDKFNYPSEEPRLLTQTYSNFDTKATGVFISSNKNSLYDSRLNISMANAAQNTSLALANTSDDANNKNFKEQQELPSRRLKDMYLDLL